MYYRYRPCFVPCLRTNAQCFAWGPRYPHRILTTAAYLPNTAYCLPSTGIHNTIQNYSGQNKTSKLNTVDSFFLQHEAREGRIHTIEEIDSGQTTTSRLNTRYTADFYGMKPGREGYTQQRTKIYSRQTQASITQQTADCSGIKPAIHMIDIYCWLTTESSHSSTQIERIVPGFAQAEYTLQNLSARILHTRFIRELCGGVVKGLADTEKQRLQAACLMTGIFDYCLTQSCYSLYCCLLLPHICFIP